jgi:large subunit ribosomal protein L18
MKKIDKIQRRKTRVRMKLKTVSPGLPRLSFNKSNQHISAQLISSKTGDVIASYHSQVIKKKMPKVELAKLVGEQIAKMSLKKKIVKIKFDRGGFVYHGCVKAFADAARKAGLNF